MTTKTPSRRVSRADYEALADIRYRIRLFLNFSEAAARAAGIEPQQHQLLLAIKATPDGAAPTIGHIAGRLSIQHHSAVELATRSVDQGLVERHKGPRDRREVLLGITPRGERILQKLAVSHRDELRSAAPLLLQSLEALVGQPRRISTKRAVS